MSYIASSILVFYGTLDFILFIQYFNAPDALMLFAFRHVLIGAISVFTVSRIKSRYKIYPYLMFWVMPGFGPLAYGLIQFSIIYFEYNQTLIFEYEKYIFYERILDLESQATFTSDVKTISLQDRFLYSQHDTKKDIISSMLSGEDSDYSYLLKDSLNDEDLEVTHYAATALNAFENELEKNISASRSVYLEKQTAINLVNYLTALEKYLESRLPDPAVERVIRKDYIILLKQHIQMVPSAKESHTKLLYSLMKLDEHKKLILELKVYFQLYPENIEGHYIIMNYLFKTNQKEKLSMYATYLRNKYTQLPERLSSHVVFWSEKDVV